MKVLHITNEFTKKNFSISSLIIFISNYLYQTYQINSSILTSSLEENLFEKKNIEILKLSSWGSFFYQNKILTRKIEKYDIIHIHGIWAPIQLISLIVCINQKKNCIVHPHGMLLAEAVKSAGYFKYILKNLSLFFLKLIINDKINFVSITNQETKAISSYFSNINIKQISNPVPFDIHKIDGNLKKKKIVYFGRIHPHKNIHLVIESFIKSELDSDWKLEIYGIKDDIYYYNYLKKIIHNQKQIEIKEPVFGYTKQKIMKEAWLNVLVSKSEVLSLSILESSLYGLPSLINKEIEVTGFDSSIIKTDLVPNNITQRMKEISRWSLEERILKEKDIIKDANRETSLDIISLKYKSLYDKIKKSILYPAEKSDPLLIRLIGKNFNFLSVSFAYMFNLMFASFLVVSFVILGDYAVAGELGLVASFWISITQIFSSNMRSIVISEDRVSSAQQTLLYRLIFSIISLIIFYFLSSSFLSFDNQKLINVTTFLIMTQWVNEMHLVQYEVQKKYNYFTKFLFFNLSIILSTAIFLYAGNLEGLTYLIQGYAALVLGLILIPFIKNIKTIKYDVKKIITLNIKTIAFLSSFSVIISSFAWRIMIYFIFDKALAGIFFACFSIGSFPGTLFNSVIGPAFIRQKILFTQSTKNILFLIFLIVLSFVTYSAVQVTNVENINYLGREFILFTTSVSLVGSYFMSYAMYLRHKQIQSSSEVRAFLFKRDIFYGISITFLIPILYNFGGTIAVSFAFIIASFIAMISYSVNSETIKVS